VELSQNGRWINEKVQQCGVDGRCQFGTLAGDISQSLIYEKKMRIYI
jgi:hypothetical protein